MSERTLSTFCSKKSRKSDAENVARLADCLAGSPEIIEMDRQSF